MLEPVDLKGKWGSEGNWLKRDYAQSFCCWPLKKWEGSWSQNVSCKCFWHWYWPGEGGRGVLGLVFLTSIADSPAGLEKSERTCHLQKRLQVTCPGGGDICFNFCWECVAGLSEPLAHYSLFCGLIIDPILVTFGRICNFWSQLSHFLFMYLPYIEWGTLSFSPTVQTFWYV